MTDQSRTVVVSPTRGTAVITNVSVAVMYVADQDASVDFYVNKLGFEKVRDEEMWPGARWIEARPPGAQTAVVFSNAADFGKEPGEGAYLTFACDDVDTTVTELRSRGVSVTDPVTEPWGTFFTVEDPDGHHVQITKRV